MTLPLSPASAVLAALVVAVGASVQASVGFGLALIAAPLLLLLIDAAFVPGPMLAAAIVLTVLVARRDHEAIDFHGLKFALLGRLAGTLPAAYVITILSATVFDVVFGVLVVVAVVISTLAPGLTPTPPRAVAAGVLSGFMATISAIGGPPMALLYQHADGPRLRGTLAGYFTVGASISLVALAAVDRFGRAEIALALVLVPGILVGFAVSIPLARRLDRGGVRPLVLGLSLAAGLVVLGRALF